MFIVWMFNFATSPEGTICLIHLTCNPFRIEDSCVLMNYKHTFPSGISELTFVWRLRLSYPFFDGFFLITTQLNRILFFAQAHVQGFNKKGERDREVQIALRHCAYF